jgi:CRP/FNR family cyclic AMP-dependent transcriptional regulator
MGTSVNAIEWVGYFASLLVLVTFCTRGMVSLRVVAIASNVAFIAYAALAGIGPVMLLHVLLLPTNVYRLSQALCERRQHRAIERRVIAPTASRSSVCPTLD